MYLNLEINSRSKHVFKCVWYLETKISRKVFTAEQFFLYEEKRCINYLEAYPLLDREGFLRAIFSRNGCSIACGSVILCTGSYSSILLIRSNISFQSLFSLNSRGIYRSKGFTFLLKPEILILQIERELNKKFSYRFMYKNSGIHSKI